MSWWERMVEGGDKGTRGGRFGRWLCLGLPVFALFLFLFPSLGEGRGPVQERRSFARELELPRGFARILLTLPEDERERALAFHEKVPLNPIGLEGDPYLWSGVRSIIPPPAPADIVGGVCAVLYEDDERERYRLQTFASQSEALGAGGFVTHLGHCGTCSTLQDLAVYLAFHDLTTPAKRCASRAFNGSGSLRCFENLGMSPACAETWYYNAKNTAKRCLGTCIGSLGPKKANNLADGSLSPCIRCDEELSGPVFLRVAGRQRRNSGIRSEIERPDAQVADLEHDYF